MITTITDTERKLQTQVNLLTTTNEVLAERLAAAETEHARDLAAYEITVDNLKAECDTHCACTYDVEKRVLQCEVHQAWHDTLYEQADYRRERDIAVKKLASLSNINAMENFYQCGLDQEREIKVLTDLVKALEADAGRYQWLREGNFTGQWLMSEVSGGWMNGMDAAIDAAMKGTP